MTNQLDEARAPMGAKRGGGLLLPDLSDDELDLALGGATVEAPRDHLRPSAGARRLSIDLGARHVEVIAQWAGRTMRGERAESVVRRLRRVVEDARRLAREMEERELLGCYEELLDIVDSFGVVATAAARRRTARRLREWTLRFSERVGGEAGARLRSLVVFRRGAFPLLERLRQIRGIGPRRLERLYSAGLTSAGALQHADPEELAELVGLPLDLAVEVVAASGTFAETERREMVAALAEMTAEVARVLRHVRSDLGSGQDGFVDEVQRVIAALEQAVTGADADGTGASCEPFDEEGEA